MLSNVALSPSVSTRYSSMPCLCSMESDFRIDCLNTSSSIILRPIPNHCVPIPANTYHTGRLSLEHFWTNVQHVRHESLQVYILHRSQSLVADGCMNMIYCIKQITNIHGQLTNNDFCPSAILQLCRVKPSCRNISMWNVIESSIL